MDKMMILLMNCNWRAIVANKERHFLLSGLEENAARGTGRFQPGNRSIIKWSCIFMPSTRFVTRCSRKGVVYCCPPCLGAFLGVAKTFTQFPVNSTLQHPALHSGITKYGVLERILNCYTLNLLFDKLLSSQ